MSQLAACKRCTRKCRRNAVSGEQVEGSREPVQQLGDAQERRAALCGLWVRLIVCARKQKQTRTNRTRIVCQGSWRCQLFTSGFQRGHCLLEGHLSHWEPEETRKPHEITQKSKSHFRPIVLWHPAVNQYSTFRGV